MSSLSLRAIDRLLARVVDRLALGVPANAVPLHPQDIHDALDRAALAVTKERFAKSLDDGSFDHEIGERLSRAGIECGIY